LRGPSGLAASSWGPVSAVVAGAPGAPVSGSGEWRRRWLPLPLPERRSWRWHWWRGWVLRLRCRGWGRRCWWVGVKVPWWQRRQRAQIAHSDSQKDATFAFLWRSVSCMHSLHVAHCGGGNGRACWQACPRLMVEVRGEDIESHLLDVFYSD